VVPDPTTVATFAAARAAVLERIAMACERVGRDPASVTLVAVSKTVDVERLRAAVAAGLTTLGENRVQEAAAKAGLVSGATWHLVGHLQSNKVRLALDIFETIQSVDSVELATRLDRLVAQGFDGSAARSPGSVAGQAPAADAVRQAVFVQVNVDEDPAKAGFQPDELPAALPTVLALANLEVRGLMTVGRRAASPAAARPTFIALRELSARLRQTMPGLGAELSMGMSDDFEVAVEEGATVVRVGRALFGERAHVHEPGEPDHGH
jgi:pyridoxal phosphate enzyme (YggS family)